MPASKFSKIVDEIQRALRPSLKTLGFKVRGRTFNRLTNDGLTQVINLQMGPSNPPGTVYIPGLRENLHGLFTVNLGVYVPEVAALEAGRPAKTWVQEYQCVIRTRLGQACGLLDDTWWHADDVEVAVAEVQPLLLSHGLPFLDRFASRDDILRELHGHSENLEFCNVPQIVSAIILHHRGNTEEARTLLSAQAQAPSNHPSHHEYVRELAVRMGLGAL